MDAATARSRKRTSAAAGAHDPKPRAEGRSAPHHPPAGVTDDDGGGVDRISGLPDAVLGEIISLLPTKDGARTQIFSPRWRHLWRSAPLNLECRGLVNHWKKLAGVVSRILSSHQGPGRRFCLSPLLHTKDDEAAMEACLQSPALDNLQELELYYCGSQVPPSTFRFSSTLCVAQIGACSIPDVSIQGLHFPLLKHLGLNDITISDSECSLHSLIGRCPVLESLLIKSCLVFCGLRINSLTIRCIAVAGIFFIEPNNVELNQLIIDNAPCLERLLLRVSAGLDKLVVAAPKLDTIGFLSDEGYRPNKDRLNRFEFGSTVIQGLRINKLAMVVPTIRILAVQMKALSLDTVIELMTCFPCLEKLYIQASKSVPNNSWRRKHQNLIKCLDISLKTIELKSYRAIKSQVNFVTFFVLNARVLELMTLEVVSKRYSEVFLAEQRMKLQLENRASRGAQFNFTTHRHVPSWNLKHVRDLEIDPFV